MQYSKRIWIAWETQRRSIELSKQFDCELFIVDHQAPLRYYKSIRRTLRILKSKKPELLFVQNPSMILAFIACTYRLFSHTRVIVDRHTTFQLNKKFRLTPRNIIFRILHYYTIRVADLTIVTNNYLATIVSKLGGNAFVLQDKIPEVYCSKKLNLNGQMNILMTSSFGKDEPIKEVLLAMHDPSLKDIHLYISGNYNKLSPSIRDIAPTNVTFTGFVDEAAFFDLIWAVDAVMALTTSEYCMLCGCYEAVSALKPLITSNKKVLEEYFKGAVFVENTSSGIENGIKEILENIDFHKKEINILNVRLQKEWRETFNALENHLFAMKA